MMMTSAHPSSMAVVSNVPPRTDTRGSETVFEKTSRMPSLGSTARSSFMESVQSGCASSARVKIPVPAPSLHNIVISPMRTKTAVLEQDETYSTTFSGAVPLTA